MSVEELETAVTRLPAHDLARFAAWVRNYWADGPSQVESTSRTEVLDRAFGAWADNGADFDALRVEANRR